MLYDFDAGDVLPRRRGLGSVMLLLEIIPNLRASERASVAWQQSI